jgi:pimeloyl-ACP methyl ester carboxylesterase
LPEIITIQTRSGPLETYQAGTGNNLALCLHGFPEHATTWHRQINMLVNMGFTVWAPNLRGYGKSMRPTQVSAYRIEHLVDDIEDVLKAWGNQPVTLIGHDWGALLGWFFLMNKPRGIERFIAIGSNHPAEIYPMNSLSQLKRAGYLPAVLIPGVAEWALASPERLWSIYYRRSMLASGGPDQNKIDQKIDQRLIDMYESQLNKPLAIRAMANWYRANADPQWWGKQHLRVNIDIPVLSLLGENDPFVIWNRADNRLSHVRNHTTKIVKNSGHWPHLEQYRFINREIQDWLESDPTSR